MFSHPASNSDLQAIREPEIRTQKAGTNIFRYGATARLHTRLKSIMVAV
jgi:hypothetical protein